MRRELAEASLIIHAPLSLLSSQGSRVLITSTNVGCCILGNPKQMSALSFSGNGISEDHEGLCLLS